MIPTFLQEKLEKQYGKEIAKQILEGYQMERKVTFRINTLKTNVETIKQALEKEKISYQEVPWSKEALIISEVREKEIQELPMYQQGEIYLQNLSSMLPPIILEPKKEKDLLDMAAAPGGKTTQMAAMVENQARITACERNAIRAEKLKYNLQKQGASCVYVMITDARNLDDFFSFDQILLDAPCSGSGTIKENMPNLEKTFTKKLIQKSTATQKALLKKAITILKPGQEMVYSTCSILEEENEEMVKQILQPGKVELIPITFKGMEEIPSLPTKLKGTLCVYPNEEYEGFFVAKIKKIK